MKLKLLLTVALLVIYSLAHAEVFVTVGEFGEVSYSDEASAGATVIELTTREPDPDDLARAAANLDRTWAFAREMEASRLAREAAVAARRNRNEPEPQQQPTYVEPRVIVGYGRRHHHPRHLLHHDKRTVERDQPPETVTLHKPLPR